MDNLKRSADSDTECDETKKVKRQRLEDPINLGDKREQVINLIKREFQNEITKRQEEVHLIQERLLKAQKTLHLLKYVIIKSFYDKKELKIVSSEESILKHSGTPQEYKNNFGNAQSRIHPAVKKLLGKKPLESISYDFSRTRGQQQNTIATQVKNEPVEETVECERKTNENEQNSKIHVQNSEEINVPIRNKEKIKYDVVIGNISKYSPPSNPQDASTYKWMVYVRGPRENPDIGHFVKKVRFFLHPSYQPNDIVEIEEPPFHLSRRGWGEFPLRIQIHFQNIQNKPIDVIHNLKLDQNRTGRQTLGNETLMNVWIHDNSEDKSAIKKEKLLENDIVKEEIGKIKLENDDGQDVIEDKTEFVDNFSNIVIKEEIKTENIKQESPVIFEPQPCCSKYLDTPNNIEPYIEEPVAQNNYIVCLVDHCYAGLKLDDIILANFKEPVDRDKYKTKIPLKKFTSTRQIVYYLFKSLPLVTNLAEDNNYLCCYPYVAATLEEFCSWNYAKRRCSEWYRAKQIKNLLQEHKILDEENWTIKFILMFGRAHAFTPLGDYTIFQNKHESGKTIPNDLPDLQFKNSYTEYIPISTLMEKYPINKVNFEDEDQIVDVESLEEVEEKVTKQKIHVKSSSETDQNMLPLCNYVKKCASQIEIYLKDEEIEPKLFHNSSERVILQSVMCLAEELIRTAWANKVVERKGRNLDCSVEKRDIIQVLLEREEFDIFTNEGLGKAIT